MLRVNKFPKVLAEYKQLPMSINMGFHNNNNCLSTDVEHIRSGRFCAKKDITKSESI